MLKTEVMAIDEDDASTSGVVDTTKGVHGALLRALGRPEIFIPLLFILAKQVRETCCTQDNIAVGDRLNSFVRSSAGHSSLPIKHIGTNG